MKMQLGNPLLIFLYSLALLLMGCAGGLYWHAAPSLAVRLAIAGASLMVIHDTLTSLIWFWIAAMWSQKTARAMNRRIRHNA